MNKDEFGMTRELTPIEAKLLGRGEELYTHSFWLAKLGIHDDTLPEDATDEQRRSRMPQLGKMIGTLFAKERVARPKEQLKFYIGKPTTMSVDFLRNYASFVNWADSQHLMVGIEEDGRIYLSSNYFFHDDPNRLPYGWMAMTLDGLLLSMGEEL
jgi:hypothetical protein